MSFRVPGVMLLLALAVSLGYSLNDTSVWGRIRLTFPEVSQIPPDSLLRWQSGERKAPPLLLDVREEEEYAVSHLEDSTRALTEDEALGLLEGIPKDTLIVVYCSVGHRSSELARKLMDRGFTNVHNLEGSIFAWANRGLPVYRGDRQVSVVHPFDETWGELLQRSLWATTPDSSDAK
jgi:rhodanese-related sulfurtransferase